MINFGLNKETEISIAKTYFMEQLEQLIVLRIRLHEAVVHDQYQAIVGQLPQAQSDLSDAIEDLIKEVAK